jgi:hypothetical protein
MNKTDQITLREYQSHVTKPSVNPESIIKIRVNTESDWYQEAISTGDWTERKTHERDASIRDRKQGHVAQAIALELLGKEHHETGFSDTTLDHNGKVIHIDINSRKVYSTITREWVSRVFTFKRKKLDEDDVNPERLYYYTVGHDSPYYYAVGMIPVVKFWKNANILRKGEKHSESGFVANDDCGLVKYNNFFQPDIIQTEDLPGALKVVDIT